MRSVRIEAPAKLNLRLRVLAPEASGYHSLETLFCAASLRDRIEIRTGGEGIELHVEGGVDTGPEESNLVVRAAHAFFERSGIEPGIAIHLEKRIPAAAGLGGGSSDAAATLRALNRLYDDPLELHELRELGAELGSDVPFFLTARPFALAWGRGERILTLEPLPTLPLVIGHPGIEMPTELAFRKWSELRGSYAPRPAAIPVEDLRSWEGVREQSGNDFEFVVFERIPALPHAIRSLLDAGARIALLAGSGAAFFGIFPDAEGAERAQEMLSRAGFQAWSAEILRSWPEPEIRIDDESRTG